MSQRSPPRGRGRGGGRPARGQPREVQVSKQLAYLLRHGAERESINIDNGGWVNVAEVLAWPKVQKEGVSWTELRNIVAANDKKRFTLKPVSEPSSPHSPPHVPSSPPTTDVNDPSRWLIRAAQGHSLKTLSSDQLLKPILATDIDCPDVVVHGSDISKWKAIEKTGGLNIQNRNHMHFARDVLEPLPKLPSGGKGVKHVPRGEGGIVSGMRRDSTLLLWADVKKSMASGMKWWRSDNDCIVTEGINGVMDMEFIVWVEWRGREVLWGDKEKGMKMKERQRPAQMANSLDLESLNGSLNGLKITDSDAVATGNVSKGKSVKAQARAQVKEDWHDAIESSPER